MATADDLAKLPGVGPATEDKLMDNGYETYMSLATADPSDLSDKADIGDSTAEGIVEAAKEEADVGGFETAQEVNEHRKKIGKISTLVPEVDLMLAGGVETQSITEFYGGFGAGKSQFSHQMCVNAQLPEEFGGVHGRAVFIDTEDSFRPERIMEMVRGLEPEVLEGVIEEEGFDFTADDVKNSELQDDEGERTEGTPAHDLAAPFLERIHVADGFNSSHQMMLAEKALDLANEYADTDYPLRLVCVDSIMANFRSEYVGRGQLAPRQQKLNRHLHDLQNIANLHNASILLANQVQSNPDAFFGDPTKPIGGNILGHTSTFRLYIKKNKGTKRLLKLDDAPNLPDGEAMLRVTMDGLKPE